MTKNLSEINLSPQNLEEALEVIRYLSEIIVAQKAEIDLLKEKLNNNSKNSSLPPSQDTKKKKKNKPRSSRKRGAQTGHKSSKRITVPEERVDKFVDCKPEKLCSCGGTINLHGKIQKHQVFEIPTPRFFVTEYKIYKGYCDSCSSKFSGQLPDGVSKKGFGARMHALVGLLTSKYRLSKSLVRSWFYDVYNMPICTGSISNIEHTVSKSLSVAYEEISEFIRQEKIVHIDETGHKECHKSAWAWLLSTDKFTFFKLDKSRGRKVAKKLIGNFHNRIIISDRYPVYNYLPDKNHQICWAHLKRDFQKISERPENIGRIGRKLLLAYSQVFNFWKIEHNYNLNFSKKQKRRLRYFKNKMLKWLKAGACCDHEKTARTCLNILDFSKSLWKFFEIAGVSPTNNHAERQLRPLVISKKLTFGTQSDRGSRYIERIFSVIATCKQQGIDAFKFITDLVYSYFGGNKGIIFFNPSFP